MGAVDGRGAVYAAYGRGAVGSIVLGPAVNGRGAVQGAVVAVPDAILTPF